MRHVDRWLYYLLACVTWAVRAQTFVTWSGNGMAGREHFFLHLSEYQAPSTQGELGQRSWKDWDSHSLDPDTHSGSCFILVMVIWFQKGGMWE